MRFETPNKEIQTLMTDKKGKIAVNRSYPKVAVQWLNQAL
jgi:hypothetical protein